MNKRFGKFLLPAAAAAVLCLAVPAAGATIVPGYIYASSTLMEEGYDHGAWCAQDYSLSTAWMEGASGHGYGESLFLETDPGTVITGGIIYPGFFASEDLFYKNNAPTRLYISTGTQEAYLDVADYASDYSLGVNGYHFLFDEPLLCDGLITVTLVGVREGWKYDDTCISEFRLEGYRGGSYSPYNEDDTHHVSLVYPDQDYDGFADGYDPFSNPDGIGGDGRGPDEYDDDYDEPDEETQWRLHTFVNMLYKLHCHHANAEKTVISSKDLYPYTHAYLLNWYQSCVDDDRISYSQNWNYAWEEDLEDIADELFLNAYPNEDVNALCDYFGASKESGRIRMDSGGNLWDSSTFYLDTPISSGIIMGRYLMMGNVMTYDTVSQSYQPSMSYYAYFSPDETDEDIYRFDELYVD